MAARSATEVSELAARFAQLYTGAVSDILDRRGLRDQALPGRIAPVTLEMKVAGPVFTGRGEPATDPEYDDMELRLAMLEAVIPGSVTVWSCGGDRMSAHWGEIMTRAVMRRGCVGALVDGALRDTRQILDLGFPVWSCLRTPAASIGRWNIVAWNCEIVIGQTSITPGDWAFADIDGAVIVPEALVETVLEEAEAQVDREELMRRDIRAGLSAAEVVARYGTF